MAKVSIIIPVYKVEIYLAKCLESVIKQTYKDLEIIVVNDGSPDDCSRIISEYASRDPRIVIVNKLNGGLSDARNAGMQVASGEYLCFLDGDDWYDNGFVEEMFDCMSSEDYDLVCCNYRYAWEDGRTKEKIFLSGLPATLSCKEAISAFLQRKVLGSVVIKMYKRSICCENNLLFLKGLLWEDLIFTQRYLFLCRKVGILQNCRYNYFYGQESISRTKETLNVLHFMSSALICVKENEDKFPGEFVEENKCFITRDAFMGVLVYSFKCKDPAIKRALKEELDRQKWRISTKMLSLGEKCMISLYRISYALAKFTYWNLYKKLQ